MSLLSLRCLCLVLVFVTVGDAVEINLFDDFDVNENMQGIMETDGLVDEGKAFLFGDKKDDLMITGELVNEIAKQAKVYADMTLSANVKIDANQEGTLLWIETIYQNPVLGIWLKCERESCKLTMLYSIRGTSHEITFDAIGPLHDQKWHKLIVRIGGMRKTRDSYVAIYVDCAKQGEKAMPHDYNHLLPFIKRTAISSHIRLAQRSRGRHFEKPWRGSLQNVKFVFNRDIAVLTDQKKCSEFKESKRKQHSPPIEMVSPIEKQKVEDPDYRYLAGSMTIIESTLSNQIEETKYLRRLIEDRYFAERKQIGMCALKPCYPDTPCTDSPETTPGYKCGDCPVGLEGNGINCTDLDECTLNPCFPSVKCENSPEGYRCGSCPDGYRGGVVVGSGRKYAMEKQVCTDIDECAESKTMCARFSECVNTVGGYKCGACADGYYGNPYVECKGISYCSGDSPNSNPCDKNAECIKKHHGRSFLCSCKVGYAGDGRRCAVDSDMDGVPDYALACTGVHCAKDNCLQMPNPDQTDVDADGRGDACDDDIDGDGIPNHKDNCPKVANKDQRASDSDSYGDACDNCIWLSNEDQADSDGTGMQGDACDSDMDDDGVDNHRDNCPMDKNPDQRDVDRDGVGDICDNCRRRRNPMQKDKDLDFVGDACDNDVDRDRDGIQDSADNCRTDPNASQLDTDSDGRGDKCDNDDDNDRMYDVYDSCPLIKTIGYTFSASFGRGKVCKHDFDGDGVKDKDDACPNDVRMSHIDFRKHITYEPDVAIRKAKPVWKVDMKGHEVREETHSDPSMLIGNQAFESVEFNGTTFVNTNTGDNMIGFVFGFQSSKSFHVVTWKRQMQNYWNGKQMKADQGLIIKEVRSSTGPSEALRNALWNSKSVRRQTRVLWKDPKMTPWNPLTSYKWILRLDASKRKMELNIFQGTKNVITSPKLDAGRYHGGRLGMFTFSQGKVLWTALAVKCL